MVSVSSIGCFGSVGSYSKPSNSSLPLFIGALHIQEYFNNNRVGDRKFINPQQEKSRCEEQRRQMRVTVQANLVVVVWELIPLESGANN